MDTLSYVLAMEEISKVDSSCSVIMSVNNSLVCWGLKLMEQKNKNPSTSKIIYRRMDRFFCLSEPEAGSDATSQRTTAIDMGDHYLLNGTKTGLPMEVPRSVPSWSSLKPIPKKGHKGINAFIVETSWQGVNIGAKDKLGIRASDTTPSCTQM